MSTTSTNNTEIDLLRICLLKIEEKLDWPNSIEWRNSHFELLSEKIFEQTQVQLSPVTLKRLWGKVSYHSFPATNTLDVLAKFLGFKNWIYFQEDFERSRKEPNPFLPFPEFPQARKIAFGALFIALLFSLTQFDSIQGAAVLSWDNGKLSFEFEPVAEGLPNTVVFTYDVKGTNADSVFIQQSWDPSLRKKVDKQGDVFTTTYYYPGFYKAKLLLNDQVVKEKDLYIESEGWLGTIDKRPLPFYLDKKETAGPGLIQTLPSHLNKRGYDLNGPIPNTSFHLVKDFGNVSGTNFNLTTEFKHTLARGEAICQKSSLVILCSETPFIIPFSIPGCVGELDLYIPGKSINGQENDLSGFGVDFSDWMNLKISVKNRAMDIKLNDRPIFHDTLLRDPGKIVGIRYKFQGTGAINYLKIESEGQVGYESDFAK